MTNLPSLYARTQTGAIQKWTVTVDQNRYQTTFGQVDGKFQTTNWTECYATNTGRSNERTPSQQALFEAEALWKKKKDSGYYENIEDIDVVKFVEPMLAKNFDDYKEELTFPVYSQPKLDGIRCIATKEGLFSRNGKSIVSCPHIVNLLKSFFTANPEKILDGELYCDKLSNDFNKICSLVKKAKPSPKDINEAATTIQYWVYDNIDPNNSNAKFTERYTKLSQLYNLPFGECLRFVPTEEVNTQEELDNLYGKYLELGYEGQMIRLNERYENKRSKFLLKRKEFQDKEYIIIDIIEGEGNKSGMAGAMVFENELGIHFNSNIKGSREYLKEIWTNKETYKGKQASVKYFNLTPDNQLPRFPYVIGIRDYE